MPRDLTAARRIMIYVPGTGVLSLPWYQLYDHPAEEWIDRDGYEQYAATCSDDSSENYDG